jgi:hypothetical protein
MGILTDWDNTGSKCSVSEDDVFGIARMLNLSEHEFFCTAAKRWGVTLERAQEDFKEYLWLSSVPIYVTDWVRMLKITPTPTC